MIYLIPRALEPDYPLIPALVVVEEFIDTVYRTTLLQRIIIHPFAAL